MSELLNLMKKETTAWDFFVPSLEDLTFIAELEESLNNLFPTEEQFN